MQTKKRNIGNISTNVCTYDENIETFYETLEEAIKNVSKSNILVIAGDLMQKLGKH